MRRKVATGRLSSNTLPSQQDRQPRSMRIVNRQLITRSPCGTQTQLHRKSGRNYLNAVRMKVTSRIKWRKHCRPAAKLWRFGNNLATSVGEAITFDGCHD